MDCVAPKQRKTENELVVVDEESLDMDGPTVHFPESHSKINININKRPQPPMDSRQPNLFSLQINDVRKQMDQAVKGIG